MAASPSRESPSWAACASNCNKHRFYDSVFKEGKTHQEPSLFFIIIGGVYKGHQLSGLHIVAFLDKDALDAPADLEGEIDFLCGLDAAGILQFGGIAHRVQRGHIDGGHLLLRIGSTATASRQQRT